MKLFKTVDEKFAEIGLVKVEESKFGVVYKRVNSQPEFKQVLCLLHKKSGMHIVQSYDCQLTCQKGIGSTCVGLTMYEMKLCLKKMKQMGWKPCKRNGG